MVDALAQLEPGQQADIQPLFISVDPERDTPQHLATYVRFFHPGLIGVTGKASEIAGETLGNGGWWIAEQFAAKEKGATGQFLRWQLAGWRELARGNQGIGNGFGAVKCTAGANLDALACGLVVTRAEHGILLGNRLSDTGGAFLEISGFTEAELIGEPHNIVRHPEMPVEAFADLWSTLKNGRPWTGLVKNRCKNGDYYWVLANATPIYQDGAVSGYMSVRTAPTREQVAAAESAYRDFREGRASGLAIHDGQVVSTGFSVGRWLRSRTIAQRIYTICTLLTPGMLVLGGIGAYSVSDSDGRLQTVYNDRVVPLRQLKDVADAYAVSIVDLSHKTRS